MNTIKTHGASAALFAAITVLGDEVSKTLTMGQIRCFLRVASAGDAGIEMERLGLDLAPRGEDMDSAALSKNVSVLAEGLNYTKKIKGFGLVTRDLSSPMDNRRKAVVLTPKGKKVVQKIVDALEKSLT